MKLYVDDERNVPAGWDVARSYDEAIEKLTNNKYDELSLDHDIASYDKTGKEKTGYDIALWLANRKMISNEYIPPKIDSHSANPIGRARIMGVITRYLND